MPLVLPHRDVPVVTRKKLTNRRKSNTGIEIAISEEEWRPFRTMSSSQMAQFLIELAILMQLPRYKKHPRGPKKKVQKKINGKQAPHVSTAKILAKRNLCL